MELNFAKEVKDIKYINSKRKTREIVGPLLNEVVSLTTGNAKKAEILNAFFASVFNVKIVFRNPKSWR